MPPTKGKQAGAAPRHPEKKYGPFQGGCGLAIWLNEVKTENGPRFFRSLTLQPRRTLATLITTSSATATTRS